MATRLKQLIEELYAPTPPSTLYHYTTLRGFMGIVQQRKIWATDARFLGDSSELQDLGSEIIRQVSQEIKYDAPQRQIFEQLRVWLADRIKSGPFVFVASFTPNGNLLSQWRGYSGLGKGVSLGFETADLAASVRSQSYRIARCIYSAQQKRKIAARVIDAFVVNALERGEAPATQAHPTQSFHHSFHELEEYLFTVAALMKNGSFEEEEEWRIVSPVHSNYVEMPILYREGTHSLVPYFEVSLPVDTEGKLLMRNVYVGPSPTPNESHTSVSRYVRKYTACPVVTNSLIPWRSV